MVATSNWNGVEKSSAHLASGYVRSRMSRIIVTRSAEGGGTRRRTAGPRAALREGRVRVPGNARDVARGRAVLGRARPACAARSLPATRRARFRGEVGARTAPGTRAFEAVFLRDRGDLRAMSSQPNRSPSPMKCCGAPRVDGREREAIRRPRRHRSAAENDLARHRGAPLDLQTREVDP